MRLTVEFLRNVYERTGLVPVRNWSRIEDQDVIGADPIYALYVSQFGKWPPAYLSLSDIVRLVLLATPELADIDSAYLWGFIDTWHGWTRTERPLSYTPEYQLGKADAEYVAQQLNVQRSGFVT